MRTVKIRKFLLCLWALLPALSGLTACGGGAPTETVGEAATHGETASHAPTEVMTQAPTEGATHGMSTEAAIEHPTEAVTEEMTLPAEAPEISERYMIFRIWNFTERAPSTFRYLVDSVAEDGFNAINIHIPWYRAESVAGVYDYTVFEEMMDYVIREKGMKVTVCLDMTRRKGDTVLTEADIMRDPAGNLCMGGSETGDRLQISFSSKNAMDKCAAFYADAVAHLNERYGEDVLLYFPTFSQYAETEYWCTGEYDYSDYAKAAFRDYLQSHYGTVAALNQALGEDFADFSAVEPPAADATDDLGRLWYNFRHTQLKAAIDRLADTQEAVAPATKFAIQLGCVYDPAAILRGTYGVTELCEKVDVLWMDDGPTMNHAFSMDYARSLLPPTVALAQEIDGPLQAGATPEAYLEQGLTSFARGCTYLNVANWGINEDYKTYRPVWQEIASTWLGEDTPAVIRPASDTPVVEISLLDVFRRRSMDRYANAYGKASPDGAFVYLKVEDDLLGNLPEEPERIYAFPEDFSAEQGGGNWYYRAAGRRGMTDMTFDALNNRWQGPSAFCLISAGSLHPDTEDAALVFKAPREGTLILDYSLVAASAEGDGVIFYMEHNGEKIPLGDEIHGGLLLTADAPLDGQLTLTVAEGDEIALIINKRKNNQFDATTTLVSIRYQS